MRWVSRSSFTAGFIVQRAAGRSHRSCRGASCAFFHARRRRLTPWPHPPARWLSRRPPEGAYAGDLKLVEGLHDIAPRSRAEIPTTLAATQGASPFGDV